MSATNRSDVRHPDDFYATPSWCTRAFFHFAKPRNDNTPGVVFDPSAGAGAILDVARDHGLPTAGIELDAERAQAAASRGHDVVVRDALGPEGWGVPHGSVVLMNPPYKLAMEFVQRALIECPRVVALLRLPWLASQKRSSWLRANTPAVCVLPKRPSFTGKGTDATDYAWMAWGLGAPHVHILGQDRGVL